jgi:type 1 glutamine amidotransferase
VTEAGAVDVLLVCGGRWHDFDYARLQLLGLLAEHERVRVRVAHDYADTTALEAVNALVTYTCDLRPDSRQQDALAAYLARGGRWFALHGTNSIVEILADGTVETPDLAPKLMSLLGGRFLAHPKLMDFTVHVTRPDHPLVQGIADFVVHDELYLAEMQPGNDVLLHTHFGGRAQRGYPQEPWDPAVKRPVLYLRGHGRGEVLYFTLGHCRGRYDMRPLLDVYPRVERGSWESPVYRELLRRGLRWVTRLEDAVGAREAVA